VDLVSYVDIKDTKCCMYMMIVLGAPVSFLNLRICSVYFLHMACVNVS